MCVKRREQVTVAAEALRIETGTGAVPRRHVYVQRHAVFKQQLVIALVLDKMPSAVVAGSRHDAVVSQRRIFETIEEFTERIGSVLIRLEQVAQLARPCERERLERVGIQGPWLVVRRRFVRRMVGSTQHEQEQLLSAPI